jgi:hypothetical protein
MRHYVLTLLVVLLSVTGVVGQEPVKVDTKGLVAKIKFESVLAGFLTELNDKYKLRVTELTLERGGYVGEHNHVGPGIRLVTAGSMTYVLPDKTVVYGPGEFFLNRAMSIIPYTTRPMRRWCIFSSRFYPRT